MEIRHLQRTEVREAEEHFGGEQRGSSAMPHKRNPVTCEQIDGLARLVRTNMLAAYENVALWHERDISHCSVERIILPDSTILVDYMLAKMTTVVSEMRVFPEPHAAQPGIDPGPGVLRAIAAGPRREGHAARRRLQSRAGKCHGRVESETSFRERVAKDPRITKYLNPKDLEFTFDLNRQLRNVDKIFARVFGAHPAGERGDAAGSGN